MVYSDRRSNCLTTRSHLIAPTTPDIDSVKAPSVTDWLDNVALRDLALHERHAACVDARGDVYQWGDAFFGENSDKKPVLTLQGKVSS
jgi:alpha-tubulin suppressor-like RCC1 family protein